MLRTGLWRLYTNALSRRYMKMTFRKKLGLLLGLYWIALFILAHVPIPGIVREAGVSDKSLHFIAYFILTFLLWFAVSGNRKINCKRPIAWVLIAILLGYAALDELSQLLVNRNCDPLDLTADAVGILVAMTIFTLLSFKPAMLIVTTVTIFLLSNITRTNVSDLAPIANAFFHLLAYAFLTLAWIYNLRFLGESAASTLRRLFCAVAGPGGILIGVKITSLMLGKEIEPVNIALAGVGILLTALFWAVRGESSAQAKG